MPKTVKAEAPASDPVYNYCVNHISSKASGGCSDRANILHARNIAAGHCDSTATDAAKTACVETKAEAYIQKAIDQHPGSASDFADKLNKILKDAGGDPNKAPTGFGAKAPTTTGGCDNDSCVDPASDPTCSRSGCDLIDKYLNPAINLFTVVFGMIAAASLIMGGINFTTSEGDPQKASRAKQRIFNTIFAVVAYIFLYAFLQFLVPGGIF